MKRTRLTAARIGQGWSQDDFASKVGVSRKTVSNWETGSAYPYPVYVQRLCEIFGKSAEDLDLVITNYDEVANIPVSTLGSSNEILEQISIGIEACNSLSDNGGHNEIVAATQIAATYLPVLRVMLGGRYEADSAALISKVFQHQHGTAYHLAGVAQSLAYSEKSVEFARMSKDVTELIVSLYELASTYEWPLPPLSVYTCRRKGLELLEEAMYLSEKHSDTVPLQVQAWLHTGYAKFLALNAKKQESYEAMGKAQDFYAKKSEDLPGLYFNEVNIGRQQAIAYSYLSEQGNAVREFLKLLDVNERGIAPKLSMPARTHLSVISETIFSLLKLPSQQKDKELTLRLWNTMFDQTQALHSATYLKECWTTYEIMDCVWPSDPDVALLRDALFSIETTNF